MTSLKLYMVWLKTEGRTRAVRVDATSAYMARLQVASMSKRAIGEFDVEEPSGLSKTAADLRAEKETAE